MDKKTYIQVGLIKDNPLKVTSSGVIVEDRKINKIDIHYARQNR